MRSDALITLLAYEARARHAVDGRRNEEAATRLASVCSRVLADLRCAIDLDLETCRRADAARFGSGLNCHNGSSAQGFVVSRTDDSIGTRRLAVDLTSASLICRYDQCGNPSEGASDHRGLTINIGNDGTALTLWDGGLVRSFATVEALSAFLLAPIFY